jgi:hypothetical protein
MLRRTLLPLVLMFAASALWAKGKVEIPDVILNSTYVMVTTYDGDLFNPDLIPEDRQAVADVQQAIEQWGRYKLVYSAREADMILVVRTGRALEARGGLQRGTSIGPGPAAGSSGQSHGAEVGDPEDTLGVFVQPANIKTAPPLWRGRGENGLKSPRLRLMQEFREKVEAAAAARKH